MNVYVLFEVVSDQYGTSRVVSVFSSPEGAAFAASLIKESRTFIKEFLLDKYPTRHKDHMKMLKDFYKNL